MQKKYAALVASVLLAAAPAVYAAPVFSGVLDSTFTGNAWDDVREKPFFTLEEYLNLRMQAKIGGSAAFYGAFNIIALAGAGAAAAAAAPAQAGFIAGDNFSSAIELERLYLRFSGERAGLDLGLFRQAFGYGLIWAPTDFLNPRNPLVPDARPRAVLAAAVSVFPGDTGKVLGFAAAPKNAVNPSWDGALAGISAETHGDRMSIQALYAWEAPRDDAVFDYGSGLHRTGLSLKADVEAGLFADVLYRLNPRDLYGLDGLAASCGADYSFAPREPKAFFQSLVLTASYLYSGAASETAAGTGGVYRQRHYLYAGVTYNATNYTALSAAVLAAPEDASFAPIVSFQQSIAQGLDLTLNAQIYPCADGEFGRESTQGLAVAAAIKLRARF
jgi:hypothetical protein